MILDEADDAGRGDGGPPGAVCRNKEGVLDLKGMRRGKIRVRIVAVYAVGSSNAYFLVEDVMWPLQRTPRPVTTRKTYHGYA